MQPSGVYAFGNYWLDTNLDPNIIGKELNVSSLHHRLDRLALSDADGEFISMVQPSDTFDEAARDGLVTSRIDAVRTVGRYSGAARAALEVRTAAVAAGEDPSAVTAALSALDVAQSSNIYASKPTNSSQSNKAPAKKPSANKASTKKGAAKKAPTKKTAAKKASTKKAAVTKGKAPAKKRPAKKAPPKRKAPSSSTRKTRPKTDPGGVQPGSRPPSQNNDTSQVAPGSRRRRRSDLAEREAALDAETHGSK